MVGELVMLPVRIGVRVTRVWFRALEETVSATTNLTGRVVELIASRSPNGAGSETQPDLDVDVAPPERTDEQTQPDRETGASASAPSTGELRSVPAPEPPAPAPAEPDHVSEEPVLVDEFAEPGAEDGAGAEVHIDPPWDGYERMNAKQVIARLADADPTELAAIQLYEGANRRRQTVMNAAARELRVKSASNSDINQPR